jgi:hypothetical protein
LASLGRSDRLHPSSLQRIGDIRMNIYLRIICYTGVFVMTVYITTIAFIVLMMEALP